MSSTLLDFLLDLLSNPASQDEFEGDPEGYLADAGLSGVCEADIADALPIVIDYAPAHVQASFDREYSTGGNLGSAGGGGADGGHAAADGGHAAADGGPGGSEHAAVITQLHHVVNNYSFVDDRDTILDNSVNQTILAYGDVSQVFDNDPVLNSGDILADGGSAVVVGNGNETAVDNSLNDYSDNSVNDSFNDQSDNSINDSFNDNSDNSLTDNSVNLDASDNSVHTVIEDSFNVDDDSINTDVVIEDSFQDNSVTDNSLTDNSINTAVVDSFDDESVNTDVVIEDSFDDESVNDNSFTDNSINVDSFDDETNQIGLVNVDDTALIAETPAPVDAEH